MTYKDRIKKLEQRLRKYKTLSYTDYLTHLKNYRKLVEDLNKYLKIQKCKQCNYVIVFLDINDFKKINDIYGHEIGNKTLKKVAEILNNNIRRGDRVYRVYGDEFAVVLPHCKNGSLVVERMKKIFNDNDIGVGIGYNKLTENIFEIIDKKMYNDKENKWQV